MTRWQCFWLGRHLHRSQLTKSSVRQCAVNNHLLLVFPDLPIFGPVDESQRGHILEGSYLVFGAHHPRFDASSPLLSIGSARSSATPCTFTWPTTILIKQSATLCSTCQPALAQVSLGITYAMCASIVPMRGTLFVFPGCSEYAD